MKYISIRNIAYIGTLYTVQHNRYAGTLYSITDIPKKVLVLCRGEQNIQAKATNQRRE